MDIMGVSFSGLLSIRPFIFLCTELHTSYSWPCPQHPQQALSLGSLADGMPNDSQWYSVGHIFIPVLTKVGGKARSC